MTQMTSGARFARWCPVAETKVWRITNFDGEDTPHFDVAIIEAPDEQAALSHLENYIEALGENAWDASIWNPRPKEEWRIKAFDGEFVLGGGCRG